MAAPASQPVRSTLLDGNHAFPPLYACYLLRSKTRPNVTYIGSSPDPPRRLRQHNGEITQGAVSTMKYRPWEMQMIVYG
jgi:structure-specific endonuclease subunit SLX1